MKPDFCHNTNEVATRLAVDITKGLTREEAGKRLEKHGPNQLKAKGKKGFFRMFLSQFKSFMIIILLIAAVISGIVGYLEGEGMLDTIVILGILIVNALIGAFQEQKAEASLEALKNMAAPITKVLRNGAVHEIPTHQLVPGDVVILETGAVVPADLRLIEAANLKIQEASLTGESVPVDKQTEPLADPETPLGDRTNLAFSGSLVTYGRGRGIVIKTGMLTEVGKIADLLQQTVDTETPMSRRLEQLGKTLGIAALIICGVIFTVGILYGNSLITMFMTAVTLAVAAIPEGLPAISTVVLAIGVQRLVKRNAIIRTLPAVETLGSATVICSDKTGTLTQNKMTVVETYVNHQKATVNREHPKTLNDVDKRLLAIAVLCTDAQVSSNEYGTYQFTGDPTETALLDFGIVHGNLKDDLEERNPRVAEIPFDSERKRMTTINLDPSGKTMVHVKGGLDEILSVCNRILIDGQIKSLDPEDIERIKKANDAMAATALRVLAMAYKEIPEKPEKTEVSLIENELIFAGMVGMIDPARPEVIEAVSKCETAGIRAVMITGDHKGTAMAIAREIGIFRTGDRAITGAELEHISNETFEAEVDKYAVYARVAPEHKVRIVKAWQKKNEIVAMTGDGVNDAPALKQADIGAAMGIVGTDVAKGAADMVLTDDNFATIVTAVEEGRRIYDNILKAIQFLLSTNIGEVFLLLVTSVFNMGIPLLPIHILWVNLVTDSLPALALSVDPAEEGIMKRKPRNPKSGFMTKGMIWRVVYQGIMMGIIPLIAYIIGRKDGGETLGQTMAFSALILAQLAHVRNLHSNTRSSFRINPLKNKPLIGAIMVSGAMALAVLLIEPIRNTFRLTTMDAAHWWLVAGLSLIPIVVVELFKLFKINDLK